MSCSVSAQPGYLVLERTVPEEKTASGLYMPEAANAREREQLLVVDIGDYEDRALKGRRVVLTFECQPARVPGHSKLLVVKRVDIAAVFNEDE